MFRYMYDLGGSRRPITADMPTSKTTKVERGEIVKITNGKVVRASPGSYLGVANETHSGVYAVQNLH